MQSVAKLAFDRENNKSAISRLTKDKLLRGVNPKSELASLLWGMSGFLPSKSSNHRLNQRPALLALERLCKVELDNFTRSLKSVAYLVILAK